MLKKIATAVARQLARIPSSKTVSNIFANATVREDGAIIDQNGKRIGTYNHSTGIGWCSLPGYIRLMMNSRKAA